MAIVQVIPMNLDGKVNGKFDENTENPVVTQTVREEYRVVDNSAKNNVSDIYENWLAAGGADIGAWYPGDASCVLKTISFKRDGKDKQSDGPFVWHVTLEFSKPEDVEAKNGVKISVSTETNDETDGRRDFIGQLNVNSAGDFFEDKLPLKNKLVIFKYQVNYASNPNTELMGWFLCTNSDAWYGLAAGTCLVRNISTDRQRHPKKGFYYWTTNIEIAYNPKGWTYKKADCGFYDRNGRILDETGAPVEKVKLLDGDGNVNNTGEAVMMDFYLYGETAFSAFNLPSPFEDNPQE